MDTFRWLAVVLSTMLGLGTTRILSWFVSAFKMRHRVTPDWLPLTMGAVVLIEIVQFWWALAELLGRPHWSMVDFALLLALAMLLFLSAALISPSEADLADRPGFFVRDGRYALLVLSLFHITALATNRWIWGQPVLSLPNAPTIGLVAICLVAAFTKSPFHNDRARRVTRIMAAARTKKAIAEDGVAAWSRLSLRHRLIQLKVRSTTQRLG